MTTTLHFATLHYDRILSPIGEVLIMYKGEALCVLDFDDYEDRMRKLLARRFDNPNLVDKRAPASLRRKLEAYFEGDITGVDDIPTETRGTAFQERVWTALRDIPAGETTSYGALAKRLGEPGASRAVGLANGSNPVAIVIPCHRVIGADGSLTGYGGGLHRKEWLLKHEGAQPATQGELGL